MAQDTRCTRQGCVSEMRALRARIRELEQQVRELTHASNYDTLTGLANRKYLGEILAVEHRALRNRARMSLSVLFIDIDHFKVINDTYGHDVGDTVLTAVGSVVRKVAHHANAVGRGRRPATFVARTDEKRQMDVARWGGEELVAVFTNVPHPERIAEALRVAVESLRFQSKDPSVDLSALRVTVSIGVATATVHAFVSKEVLLRKADAAMYAAKEDGRNCVRVATICEIVPGGLCPVV